MGFKEQMVDHLKSKGINITKVEQEGENKSIVCHIPESDNSKIEDIRHEMEKEFDVAVMRSDMGGFNVVIVEANDMGEE